MTTLHPMTLKIIIFLLAGFLISYHSVKVYSLFTAATSLIGFIDIHGISSVIRTAIIAALIMVVFNIKYGLVLMWISISALITLQYFSIDQVKHWSEFLSPLKGLIIPTILTILSHTKIHKNLA